MLKLYENIKKYRIERGWNQSDLAKRVGYSDKSMISKIEKGLVDLSQSQIQKFADVFGVSASELFGPTPTQDLQKNRFTEKEKKQFMEEYGATEEELVEIEHIYEMYLKADDRIKAAVEALLYSQEGNRNNERPIK